MGAGAFNRHRGLQRRREEVRAAKEAEDRAAPLRPPNPPGPEPEEEEPAVFVLDEDDDDLPAR